MVWDGGVGRPSPAPPAPAQFGGDAEFGRCATRTRQELPNSAARASALVGGRSGDGTEVADPAVAGVGAVGRCPRQRLNDDSRVRVLIAWHV